MNMPFEKDASLSGSSIETLRDWLSENALPETKIAGDYTVADIISDIDRILNGMWSDGIDAMGEDA